MPLPTPASGRDPEATSPARVPRHGWQRRRAGDLGRPRRRRDQHAGGLAAARLGHGRDAPRTRPALPRGGRPRPRAGRRLPQHRLVGQAGDQGGRRRRPGRAGRWPCWPWSATAGPNPPPPPSRFSLLEPQVRAVIRVPFVAALRLADDPAGVPLPRRRAARPRPDPGGHRPEPPPRPTAGDQTMLTLALACTISPPPTMPPGTRGGAGGERAQPGPAGAARLVRAGEHAAGLVEVGCPGRRGVRADRLRRDDGDRPPQPRTAWPPTARPASRGCWPG